MCNKKQKSTSTSTSSLNDWSRNRFETGSSDILDVIEDFNTNNPYQPYTGEMVAGLSDNEQRARDLANTNLGSTAGMFGDAANLINRGASADWTPEQIEGPTDISATAVDGPREVNYRTFDAGRIEGRLNPYREQVVDAAGAYFDETRDQQIMNNQARATQSGAFGGSRHGVADAEFMRTAAMDKANLNANLLYSGWGDAVAADERETQGIFGADTFNATGDYNARRDNAVRSDAAALRNSDAAYENRRFNAGRNDEAARWAADNSYRAAGALSDLAVTQQGSWMNEVNMMNQLGMDEREIENARLLAERAQYDEQAAEQWRRMSLELQTRIGLLGATPMLLNTTGTNTTTVSDPMGQLSSLLEGIGSLSGLMPAPKG